MPPTSSGSRPERRGEHLQLGDAALQEAALGLDPGEHERPPIGLPGSFVATETPQQLGAGRVQVLVVLELEALEQRERLGGPRCSATATARLSTTTGERVTVASRA